MNRLSAQSLSALPAAVRVPGYRPEAHGAGIVHLGTGAFHRAHQAVYTDDAIASAGGDWRIIGSSLRSPATQRELAAQDFLYSVLERSPDQQSLRVLGSVKDVIFAPDDPAALIAAIADPATRVVTLTITEKGYCFDRSRGCIRDRDALQHDIANPRNPTTAPGYLVAGLRQRRETHGKPISVLSCDNLPNNGAVIREAAVQLAARSDAALARWIEDEVRFPSSMVDRIVPAATDDSLQRVEELLGQRDRCALLTEPFSQWVIEDDFCEGRPAWESAGALCVAQVQPYEDMKLRLLNGSHSTLAYLGSFLGIEYIHEALAIPRHRALIQALMALEMSPTLTITGFDLGLYRKQLLARFANAAVPYRCAQVAADGSEKLPQRILAPLRERLGRGESIDCLALTVALWIGHVGGLGASSTEPLADPMADVLIDLRRRHGSAPSELASALLARREIFGDDLACDERFTSLAHSTLRRLLERGIDATIEHTLNASRAARPR